MVDAATLRALEMNSAPTDGDWTLCTRSLSFHPPGKTVAVAGYCLKASRRGGDKVAQQSASATGLPGDIAGHPSLLGRMKAENDA